MAGKQNNKELIDLFENLWNQYQISIAVILFIIGILFRSFAINKTGIDWQLVNDFGTFIAGSIAISFIYTIFSKTGERQLFLNELDKLLDAKLASYGNKSGSPQFYEEGRISLAQKVKLLEGAKKEIIHLGIASSSFASYFEQVPFYNFEKPVIDLLKRGVNFKLLILNPDSDVAEKYAQDRGETKLLEKIRNSIEVFEKLRDRFNSDGYPGKFDIFLYSHFPYCYVMMSDPNEKEGCALISHYLYATKRADTPVIEVYKSSNRILFEKYHQTLNKLLNDSRKL